VIDKVVLYKRPGTIPFKEASGIGIAITIDDMYYGPRDASQLTGDTDGEIYELDIRAYCELCMPGLEIVFLRPNGSFTRWSYEHERSFPHIFRHHIWSNRSVEVHDLDLRKVWAVAPESRSEWSWLHPLYPHFNDQSINTHILVGQVRRGKVVYCASNIVLD
jgi:hypothetical protein